MAEPFDAVEVGEWIVISDRRAGAVYRLDRRDGRVGASGEQSVEARELEPRGDGVVLVTSGERVLRVWMSGTAHGRPRSPARQT